MINRTIEPEILPYCGKQNIGTINYAPMHSGLLTGSMTKERVAAFPSDDFRRNAKSYQGEWLKLSRECHPHGSSVPAPGSSSSSGRKKGGSA